MRPWMLCAKVRPEARPGRTYFAAAKLRRTQQYNAMLGFALWHLRCVVVF